jgi:hypothetical protein
LPSALSLFRKAKTEWNTEIPFSPQQNGGGGPVYQNKRRIVSWHSGMGVFLIEKCPALWCYGKNERILING